MEGAPATLPHEEIYYLPRVPLELGMTILSQTIGLLTNEDGFFVINARLVWFFGNGIPREIKRNLLVLSRKGLNLTEVKPGIVWLALTKSLIESSQSWALLQTKEEEKVYEFLVCLDEVTKNLPADATFEVLVNWYRDFRRICKAKYDLPFLKYDTVSLNDAAAQLEEPFTVFEKAIFDFALATSSFRLLDPKFETEFTIAAVERIFAIMNFSSLFAAHRFHQLMRDVDVSHE